jgi:serine/threonine-protein kinase
MKKLDFWRADWFPGVAGSAGGFFYRGALRLDGAIDRPTLGRYRLDKTLGKGATGTVYLGKNCGSGRVVAIKTLALSPELDPDELKEMKDRFFREAETAGRLSHPNIVTIYETGEEHGLAYIAMELLEGKNLTPYVKPGNLFPLTKVLSIVARVADALACAHRNGVAHRDIKPANIMYEPKSDTVKVTDFGIACVMEFCRAGVVLGTPSYMSPEQLAGSGVDGRSDLFSLGATLYQLLCGQSPFKGASMAELMFRIANEAHVDVRAHDSSLPACVAAIVNKALAKYPGQRYRNGEQMARALRLSLGNLTARPVAIQNWAAVPAASA